MNLKLKSIEKHELLSVSQRPERVWSLGALGGPAVCSPGQAQLQLPAQPLVHGAAGLPARPVRHEAGHVAVAQAVPAARPLVEKERAQAGSAA